MKAASGKFIIFIYTALFAGLYYSPFSVMVTWWKRDDYSYCYLIPVIVLYLLWEKKAEFASKMAVSDWKGIIPLVTGIGFYWLGELGGEFYIMYLSSWLILIGICVLHLGIQKVRTITFPLGFILAMFPLPNFFNFKIILALKLISTKIGVLMMQAYGMSVFRDGNVIDLGFTKLQVVDACSGLRYLFPMIVLSILIAYYYRTKLWKRLIIVFSSVPLTIFSNSLRIALTGILSEKFGSAVVEGFFHDFEGILIFLLTLLILLAEIWVFKRLFPDKDGAVAAGDDQIEDEPDAVAPENKANFLKTPQFIVSVILLAATLGFSQGIEFREAVPMSKSFADFPMQVGKWTGRREIMEDKFIDTLNFTDYVMADYADASGRMVNFYVAYYASQRKGESIHSPESCLRGGGWKFKEAGGSVLELNDNRKLPFNRALIEKEPVLQVSYYWFPSRDRVLTNIVQMKWYNFWDALTRQRTDGALVRVITLVYPNEDVPAAETRIQNFVRDVYPVLEEYLPR